MAEEFEFSKTTAVDLKYIPYLRAVSLWLRGMQRIIWGYSTVIMDYMVLSGSWKIQPDSIVERSFFLINLLVLGFLFGERAIQNVAPALESLLKKKE